VGGFGPFCGGTARWKHWPSQPEPMSPDSVHLLVSGFPPVHLKPAVRHCTTSTHTHTRARFPPVRVALVPSTRTVTCSSVTSSFQRRKRSAYLCFCFSGLSSSQKQNDLHRLDDQDRRWNVSLWKRKNKNCALFTSRAVDDLESSFKKRASSFVQGHMTVYGHTGY